MGDEDAASDAQYAAEITAREKNVESLLAVKNRKGALQAALASPPVATKDQKLKDRNAIVVEKVLCAVTDSEAQGIVDSLDADTLDVLMKFLYRTMGRIDKSINYALILKMHAMVTAKAGLGSIVRSLSDRKQV